MALARMRSIYEALDLIREADKDTAITYNTIKNLCLDGKIRYFKSGNKIILNFDDLADLIGESQNKQNPQD